MIGENIKHFRQRLGKSQSLMAEETGIHRSTLAGYEADNNEPNIERLRSIAGYFGVTVDELISGKKEPMQPGGKGYQKVLAISVDKRNRENIEWVPVKARAGYLAGYQDTEYIKELPAMSLPNIPAGTFRAFEIAGDSMLPINDGSIVLGSYVRDLAELKNNHRYILVSQKDGIIFKRIIRDAGENLLLYSDNPAYPPFSISPEEILELWLFYAFIGYPKNESHVDIVDIVVRLNNIDSKLNRLIQ
jgi:transcriptional regulator with XRE-family HTH domain